jgi:integrase
LHEHEHLLINKSAIEVNIMKGVNSEHIQPSARRHGRFLFRDLCARYPDAIRIALKGARSVGVKTRRERRVFLRAALRRLCELGFCPSGIDRLKSKHIRALCRDMEDRRLAAATIATGASHLSALCKGIGKPELTANVTGYFLNPRVLVRSGVARRDKSLEGAGIDFADIYQRALAIDARVACMLELCHVLGLRSQEAWLFRPHAAIQSGIICVYWGAKGGRKRQLPFAPTDEHRALIEKAKSFVLTEPESMIPRGVSLLEWKSRWQRVMTKIGLTRGQLGVTPHSLRHSMLCRYYTEVSGHEPPVRGGTLHETDPHADRAARDLTADPAGHCRRSVTSAYIGGTRSG